MLGLGVPISLEPRAKEEFLKRWPHLYSSQSELVEYYYCCVHINSGSAWKLENLSAGGFYTGFYTGFYGDEILYKNLDLTQDFPNKILFHFLWEQNLVQKSSKIFRWPEMCSLGKIFAQDFQMAAVTKILMRRDKSIAPLLSLRDDKQKTQKRTWRLTAMQ